MRTGEFVLKNRPAFHVYTLVYLMWKVKIRILFTFSIFKNYIDENSKMSGRYNSYANWSF